MGDGFFSRISLIFSGEQAKAGSVPVKKYSFLIIGQPVQARVPVKVQISTSLTSSGLEKFSTGWFSKILSIIFRHIGEAPVTPEAT